MEARRRMQESRKQEATRETASNQQEREQMENAIKELLTEIENNYIIKKKAEAKHMPSFYYNQDRSF